MPEYKIVTSQPRVKPNSSEVQFWIFGMSITEGDATISLDGKWVPERTDLRDFDYTPELIRYEFDMWAKKYNIKERLKDMLDSRQAKFTPPLNDSVFIEGTTL